MTDLAGSYDVLRIPHVSIPVRESKLVSKWRAMLVSDFGGSPTLIVGDLLLWRTRVAVHEAVKAMFDAERTRLGLA